MASARASSSASWLSARDERSVTFSPMNSHFLSAESISRISLPLVGAHVPFSMTAIFLFYTFGPKGNGQPQYSWFIWAVGGVLYAAVMGIVSLVLYHKDKM